MRINKVRMEAYRKYVMREFLQEVLGKSENSTRMLVSRNKIDLSDYTSVWLLLKKSYKLSKIIAEEI